jgi:hypothetical protein
LAGSAVEVAAEEAAAPTAPAVGDPTAAVAAEVPTVAAAVVAPLRLAVAWAKVAVAKVAAPSQLPAAVVQPLTSAGPFAKSVSSPFYCPDKILSDKMQAGDHNRNTDTAMSGSATRHSCTIVAGSQHFGNRWQLTTPGAQLRHRHA